MAVDDRDGSDLIRARRTSKYLESMLEGERTTGSEVSGIEIRLKLAQTRSMHSTL